MALSVGQKAPNFTLPSTSNQDFTLYEAVKDKPCIIYFYPKDFTNVCTEQACSFRDEFSFFRDLDITVVGISKDDIPTHHKFKDAYNLPFELLADTEGKVAKLYDSLVPIVGLVSRNTYILDKNQTIVSVYSDLFSGKNKIREVVQQLTQEVQQFSK